MAKEKRTPVYHQSKLKFPQDVFGITMNMKREGARTIGRMAGKDDRLAVVLGTLEVLRQYAIDKLFVQKMELKSSQARKELRRAVKAKAELGQKMLQAKIAQEAAVTATEKANSLAKEMKELGK